MQSILYLTSYYKQAVFRVRYIIHVCSHSCHLATVLRILRTSEVFANVVLPTTQSMDNWTYILWY